MEIPPNNGVQCTLLPTSKSNYVASEQKNTILKALPLLEISSAENNFTLQKETAWEVSNRKCENVLFFRTVQPKEQNSQSKLKNPEEGPKPISISDTKSDSPKFLRPVSSIVIKKPSKKLVLPVSNSWNGLVKTVENLKERKKGNRLQESETGATSSTTENVTNSFSNDEKKQTERDTLELNNSKTRASDVLEDLFGSPLKWAENSNETTPLLELNSPTVYEDSCSAHIENAKFHSNLKKTVGEKSVSIDIAHSTETHAINCKTVTQIESSNEQPSTSSNMDKLERAFEEVGGNKHRMKSIFSPLKTDSCKSSSIGLGVNTGSIVDLRFNFPFKSKYEDSVLGQFDDTTQFVSALTKVESKISPLNTPVKSISVPAADDTILALNMAPKTFSQAYQTSESNHLTSSLNSMSSNKNFSDRPINILYPRKTPRIVTYGNKKEEKACTKHPPSVNDTPTKCNRFAINDAFISQQEEKVMRICKNNVKDPIAITINAKKKTKIKESNSQQSPPGKGSQVLSPRKSKLSPCCLKKNRGTVHGSLTVQEKHTTDRHIELSSVGNNKLLLIDNSSCKLPENNREGIALEIPSLSVQETERNDITTIQNLNCDNQIEKDSIKQTFNDFPVCSVIDGRKANDLEDRASIRSNNQETRSKKLCTPDSNINNSDYKNIGSENKFGSENIGDTVTEEKTALKESIPSLSEDVLHNKTGIIYNLNTENNCIRTRIQNFKPSSLFKKSNKHTLQYKKQECEKTVKNDTISLLEEMSRTITQDISTNYNEITPKKCKANDSGVESSKVFSENINENQNVISLKDSRKSPNIIIRSSKKPEFVSTTLSDDDFASKTVLKSPDMNCRNYNKGAEIKEWILKPITFETTHSPFYKKNVTDNQKCVPRFTKIDSDTKTSMSCDVRSNGIRKINFGSTASRNKTVIPARRPLNFGVKVTLD